ncbi:hypothetical protein PInf_020176 [Phytophthora infestans]|nr:hypothetical protein PInf_020176 [Phytophthora infestans]
MSTCDASNAAVTRPARRPVIYLTGDSLTERGTDPNNAGWIALMQDRYNRSADIAPRGLSGYNTKWFIESALPALERELSGEVRSPCLITLWLGANDAALPDGTAARQHVPLATYKENLATIARSFQAKAPRAHILLITPPHVDDAVRKSRSPIGCAERTNAAAASDGAMIEDTNNQPLRLLEKITTADDGEERMAEARLMDSEILEKIVNDHAYAKQVFRSWLQNGQTKEDIENRLRRWVC